MRLVGRGGGYEGRERFEWGAYTYESYEGEGRLWNHGKLLKEGR